MSNQEKSPTYDSRAEYGERPGYDSPSPAYGEMPNSFMGEKVAPPRRFWTPAKISAAVVIVIVLLGGFLCISQSISIQQRQYDVQGKVGIVWNEVDRASQLLAQDAA